MCADTRRSHLHRPRQERKLVCERERGLSRESLAVYQSIAGGASGCTEPVGDAVVLNRMHLLRPVSGKVQVDLPHQPLDPAEDRRVAAPN